VFKNKKKGSKERIVYLVGDRALLIMDTEKMILASMSSMMII